MKLEETRSQKALKAALQAEAMAEAKYHMFAKKAREEGFYQIGKLFQDIAENENAHARVWYEYLHNGEMPSTLDNLKDCAATEDYEHIQMYPQMAQVAVSEGLQELAEHFLGVAKIEGHHREMYLYYIDAIQTNTLYEKGEATYWLCENCGHLHYSKQAPSHCPVCFHPQGYFTEYTERY